MKTESEPIKTAAASEPVIVWEQPAIKEESEGNLVHLDSYRQKSRTAAAGEATITSWVLTEEHVQQPIRLIMVSSDFGGKPSISGNTLRSMAA